MNFNSFGNRYFFSTAILFFSQIAYSGPIHEAVKAVDLDKLQELILASSNPLRAVNEPDETTGESPLHIAAVKGDPKIVAALLSAGATPEPTVPSLLSGSEYLPGVKQAANTGDFQNLTTALVEITSVHDLAPATCVGTQEVGQGLKRAAGSPGLQKLDEVLSKAKNLDDFLSREDLIQEYYRLAKVYYSTGKNGNFEEVRYREILDQLREVSHSIPDLKPRFWKSPEGEGFQIETETNHIEENEEALIVAKKYLYDTLSSFVHTDLLKVNSTKISLEIIRNRLDKKIPRTPESRKKFEAAVAFILRDFLDAELSKPGMNAKKAILLLDKVRHKKFQLPGLTSHSIITEQIKAMTPTRHDVQMKYFKRNPTTRWSFQPVHPFHGIFRGIELDECMFGKKVSRWALVAIKGSQLSYVEKDGKFRGFIHLIPIQNTGKTGTVYGSVDVAAYDFPKKVRVVGPDAREETLFDAWYKEASKRKSTHLSGFAMSDDGDVNNAGARNAATESIYYRSGKSAGEASQFSTTEPDIERKLYDLDVSINERRDMRWYFGEDRHPVGKGLFECSLSRNKIIQLLAVPE